jgi:hypothetical protein
MPTPEQWLKNIENAVPYVPNTKNKSKKLPMPKTRYKIYKLFKKPL